MISKARIKQIHGLERKKNRLEEGLFVAEGHKLVGELLTTMQPTYIAATSEWLKAHSHLLGNISYDTVDEEELRRASLLQHPQSVLALFPLPKAEATLADVAKNELTLALDGVQDPGNMGTIVRLADWFGIHHVFCSLDSADIFNPKATQATMGALARVNVHYINLAEELQHTDVTIYGTFLDGDNIYNQQLSSSGIIIMGNEGKGVSAEVARLVNRRLYIPPYPADSQTVESLNVAIATAITCSEFRRRGCPS